MSLSTLNGIERQHYLAYMPQAKVYNVGKEYTPIIAERLACLPQSTLEPDVNSTVGFHAEYSYDTSRIRTELGYREIISEEEGLLRTLERPSKLTGFMLNWGVVR
jgi:nucleoside-diphosphate-sugar epimerase